MPSDPRGFFTLNPRRKFWNMLQQPAFQLKLPLAVIALTVGFAILLGVHTYTSYGKLVAVALAEVDRPLYFARAFEAQTKDLILTSIAITTGFVLAMITICVVWAHRVLGPIVPIRRHVQALQNGDFSSRIRLREGDGLGSIADDLNELAELLGNAEKPTDG